LNAERKVERIREMLTNDGRGWTDPLEMLQEIESIVEPKNFTVTCTITEADMDKALSDGGGDLTLLRQRIGHELNAKLDELINAALRAVR
jgi:hypothetical protein